MTSRCLVDSHKSPDFVDLVDIGDCVETTVIMQVDFEFGAAGSFTRLHMRCLRCKSTSVEYRAFEHADLAAIA